MARTLILILIAASCAASTGCARTTLLINHHEGSQTTATTTTGSSTTATEPTSTGPSPEAQAYLAALSREQAKLAAAERKIPRKARTPTALARSIGLLALAIVRLGNDLKTISPPAAVASHHAQLISIVQTYAARLAAAQHIAVTSGGELPAVHMLVDATTAASSAFGSTVNQINVALRH